MTTTIAENVNRDMFLGPDGNVAFISNSTGNPVASAQLTKSRIESQRGEMIYNFNGGMPTRATAFDQFNPNQFEAAARAIINATADVTGVSQFGMYRQNNTLFYTAVITTIWGVTTVTGQQ